MFTAIYISDCICTIMCLCTIIACKDGMTVKMCPCAFLDARGMVYYWMDVYCSKGASIVCHCRYCTDMDVFVSMSILYYITTQGVLRHIEDIPYISSMASMTSMASFCSRSMAAY